MSGADLLILAALILLVAKIYYAVGKIVGKGEIRAAHDLYQKAANMNDHEQRMEIINKANNLVFPDRPFIKAFKLPTRK